MNDSLEAVCWANDLRNRYGMDTISAGIAVAFAMEVTNEALSLKTILVVSSVMSLLGADRGKMKRARSRRDCR